MSVFVFRESKSAGRSRTFPDLLNSSWTTNLDPLWLKWNNDECWSEILLFSINEFTCVTMEYEVLVLVIVYVEIK